MKNLKFIKFIFIFICMFSFTYNVFADDCGDASVCFKSTYDKEAIVPDGSGEELYGGNHVYRLQGILGQDTFDVFCLDPGEIYIDDLYYQTIWDNTGDGISCLLDGIFDDVPGLRAALNFQASSSGKLYYLTGLNNDLYKGIQKHIWKKATEHGDKVWETSDKCVLNETSSYPVGTLSISADSINLTRTSGSDYYEGTINLSHSNLSGGKYKLTNNSGIDVSTTKGGSSLGTSAEIDNKTLYVRIPAKSIKEKTTYSLSVSGSYKATHTNTITPYVWVFCQAGKCEYGERTYQRVVRAGFYYKEEDTSKDLSDSVQLTVNPWGSLRILKMNAKDSKHIEGAEFELLDSKNERAKDINGAPIPNKKTNASGIIDFTNLPYGTYTIKEVSAAPGYEQDNLVEINGIEVKDVNVTKVVTNEPIKTVITKKDITDEKELKGAHIIITDEKGSTVDEYDTTEESHEIYLGPGTYTLKETVAPEGYEKITTEFKFKVEVNGDIDLIDVKSNQIKAEGNEITLYNTPRKIKITKKDITSEKELKGAHIVIKNEKGDIVKEFDSKEKAEEFMLDPGVYTLTETISPEGYEKVTTEFKFEVLKSKEIKLIDVQSDYIKTKDNEIILYNKLVEVPDTGKSNNIMYLISGAIAVALGTLLIVFTLKKRKVNNI